MSRRICDASSNSSVLESTSGACALHSGEQVVKQMRETLVKIAKWLVRHVKIYSRDLNRLERGEHDDNRKPKSAVEVKLKWDF